jgi:hypothetical protein
MATSGTVTFSMNESEIITDALQSIGYLDPGEAIDGTDLAIARRKLNMIVKQWTSQLDFAPGLKMWTRRRAYVFLQQNQVVYSLGPSGDNATETYVSPTLSASAANGAGTVTVSSATGISSGDYIGVLLDSGAVFWTTVSGAPAGSVVTLASSLTGAASSGNRVFAYTTKMRRPFEIISGVRRDAQGNDTPIDVNMTVQEYENIYSKTSEGEPSRLYFEAQRTNAVAYIDCAPEDCSEVLRLVYLSYIEDFTATTDDMDFPAEWGRALSAQLSMDCCLPFGRPIPQALPAVRDEALAFARKAYAEVSTASYQTDPDDY